MPPDTLPAGVAIGLTGGFGSGCTTAAKEIRDKRHAKMISLSEAIKLAWKKTNPDIEPTRHDLQKLGDQMRADSGSSALVGLALDGLSPDQPVVVDGIRNLGEVAELRERYGYRFTLMAIMTSSDDRWDRIGHKYTDDNRSREDFLQDDGRDRNEETKYGQQVELCVDASDVLIDNGKTVDPGRFKSKVVEFVDLVTGLAHRHPNQDEVHMNIAYGSSHSSKCIKRHVGAIVVDSRGEAVGVGYNENPLTTKPCIEEQEYGFRCYRDIVRDGHFSMLAQSGAKCPSCGQPIIAQPGPPWQCETCRTQTPPIKTNLETLFFPDRAMNWCTAIHAEVWALNVAGDRARGGTLYTTTFPCFQCTERIIHAGIKKVCYTEAYADAAGEMRFELANVEQVQFEGVRSASFERIFTKRRT